MLARMENVVNLCKRENERINAIQIRKITPQLLRTHNYFHENARKLFYFFKTFETFNEF